MSGCGFVGVSCGPHSHRTPGSIVVDLAKTESEAGWAATEAVEMEAGVVRAAVVMEVGVMVGEEMGAEGTEAGREAAREVAAVGSAEAGAAAAGETLTTHCRTEKRAQRVPQYMPASIHSKVARLNAMLPLQPARISFVVEQGASNTKGKVARMLRAPATSKFASGLDYRVPLAYGTSSNNSLLVEIGGENLCHNFSNPQETRTCQTGQQLIDSEMENSLKKSACCFFNNTNSVAFLDCRSFKEKELFKHQGSLHRAGKCYFPYHQTQTPDGELMQEHHACSPERWQDMYCVRQ